jgi:hypothetical protein
MDPLNKTERLAGDIILYHGNSLLAKLIQFFDGTEMNHAGIYLGEGMVGEALDGGLKQRTLEESMADDEYVIVRRLITDPGTMDPVVNKARDYLAIGNRYGFEQIFLLAFLGLTRKLQVNPFLEWLLRKLFDQAASWLMNQGDKQPMICSEFAYRCYDEALPVANDPYALDIVPFPGTISRSFSGTKSFPVAVLNRNVHQDSLLAWTEEVASRRSRSGSNVLLHSLGKGAAKPVRRKLSAEEKKFEAMPLETLAKNYLEETKKPTARSRSMEASLRSPEMLGDIYRLGQALIASTKIQRSKALKNKRLDRSDSEVPEALENLFQTAADFVTPGDLYGCRELFTVGNMMPE